MSKVALIISGSPFPSSKTCLQHLASLADVVVACDKGFKYALDAGVVPDVLVGDFDSLEPQYVDKAKRLHITVEEHTWHKDKTDTHLAVELVESAYQVDEIIFTCTGGGRPDHALAFYGLLLQFAHLKPSIYEDAYRIWLLEGSIHGTQTLPGSRSKLEFDETARDKTLSILSLSETSTLSVTGTEWELQDAELRQFDSHGISNIVRENHSQIIVKKGCVAVYLINECDFILCKEK